VSREATPRQHATLVLPMLDGLLTAGGLSISDIDAIGFSCGPGSFVGLRIGMGIVQGLAFGVGIPVVPVSTLQAIAQVAIDRLKPEEGDYIVPVIDARMNEVYWGVYINSGGRAVLAGVDSISTPAQVQGEFSDHHRILGVGDGWQFIDQIPIGPNLIKEEISSDAEQVLLLSMDSYLRGLGQPIEKVEPLYLRRASSWKKRQGMLDNPDK
jgi:tRNA threonylcarbamoyladenosine biosynthesis protein TsaB